ncbi:unnamed protein product [Citrullus colocynthis]|uniref:Uncharacterized protein n=1 Tax=Citrullus colocynthis TaxID=252529 RepID=A0ABP0YGB0_9ROSI
MHLTNLARTRDAADVLGNLVDVGDVERGLEAGMGKELVVEEAEDEFTPLTRHRREVVVRSNQKGGLGMVVHNSFETLQGMGEDCLVLALVDTSHLPLVVFAFVEVCYLVETRVRQENFDSVVARFGMKWGSVCSYSVAGVRRNWVLWNASLYDFNPGVLEDHARPKILTNYL